MSTHPSIKSLALLCSLLLLLPASAEAASRKSKEKSKKTSLKAWKGPAKDFAVRDDRIYGEWWQGGGLGVAYYTGPNATRMKVFVDLGQKIAKQMSRPYMEIHKEHLQPTEEDPNGILAYPDGTARVRLLFMPGGNSTKTMMEIYGVKNPAAERAKFAEGRKTPQAAYRSGMNYVGVCGGFYTAASGYNVPRSLFCGWGFWPGKCTGLGPGMKKPFPSVVVDEKLKKHPLYKVTQKGRLDNMFFNGGPLGIETDTPDTVYFGTYEGGNMPKIIGKNFLISYRPSDNGQAGRVVAATGHPEVGHKAFLAAMAEHAIDHDYEVPRKFIESGNEISNISGDDQMQYYCIKTEAGKTLTLTLAGLEENCDLYLRHKLPPTFKKKDAKSARSKTSDETIKVNKTKAGEYFIGIHGKHKVLKGTPYKLKALLE